MAEIQVSQGGVEVAYQHDETNVQVSQVGIEVAWLNQPPTPTPGPNMICHPPFAQLLYPTGAGTYGVAPLDLYGPQGGTLIATIAGLGTPPLHYLSQRGPYQHGSTALDYRWDERTLDIEIFKGNIGGVKQANFRWDLLDYLRPSRTFYTGVTVPQPMKLRYFMPGGDMRYGDDLALTAGSAIVTSTKGRFVHFGLRVGERFSITGSAADNGNYTVVAVPNDYTIQLDSAMVNDETDVEWNYRIGQSIRELHMLMQEGPQDNRPNQVYPAGIDDIISFAAHDPFWYGEEQTETWDLGSEFDALVFDDPDYDAWFGPEPGQGTWLFADNYLSRQVNMVYWGHEPVNPVIEITGPANIPIIENSTANVTLTFNYDIVAGEVVTIDTLNLTVTNNFGESLYTYLTGDVATFKLAPDPEAPSRLNTVTITFGGASIASQAILKWQNKYINLA